MLPMALLRRLTPQLSQAALILFTRELNNELRGGLELLKGLLGGNAKQQHCIGIFRTLGRGLIGGRTRRSASTPITNNVTRTSGKEGRVSG